MVFLYAPLAVAVLYAFSAKPLLAWPFEGWSLQWFEKLFSERQFRRALATSFEVAAWTAVFSTVIGTAAAFVFTRRKSRLTAVGQVLSGLPVMLPGVFIGIGFVALMVLSGFGPGKPMIVAGHTVVATPWVVLVMTARLLTYDSDLEAAARDLGASPMQVLRRVSLPILAPALDRLGVARLRLVVRRDAGDDIHRGQRDDRAALHHRAAAPGGRSVRQRGGGAAADDPVDHLHRRGADAAPRRARSAFGPRR